MNFEIPKILAIGAATQDVFLKNSRALRPAHVDGTHELIELEIGAKIDVNEIHFATGGGATNAATTFARNGLKASFMGAIGDDLAGRQILESLDAEFIDTSRVEILPNYNTDYSTVILSSSGERTILTYRGASSHIFADNFSLKMNEFDWIYVTNLAGNFDALNRIFAEATSKGAKIMWNPGKKELENPEKVRNLLEDVEVLLVNKQEAQAIFGEYEGEELLIRARNLVKVAIVTDGANGVWASDGETLVRAGMYEDVPRKDTTGAGDAFGSGFLAQWALGAPLKPALLFASANSTSVIQQIGAKAGILRRSEEFHSMPMYEKRLDV